MTIKTGFAIVNTMRFNENKSLQKDMSEISLADLSATYTSAEALCHSRLKSNPYNVYSIVQITIEEIAEGTAIIDTKILPKNTTFTSVPETLAGTLTLV